MGEWNVGMLEYWEGIEAKIIYLNEQKSFKPIIPLLHYSITPIGAKPLSSISGGVYLNSLLMVFAIHISRPSFIGSEAVYRIVTRFYL